MVLNQFKRVFVFITLFQVMGLYAQQSSSISDIIDKIYDLEKERDPKCYATANRLEDFMYGTPLEEEARNLKIDIQKEFIYYLKEKGSALAKNGNHLKIKRIHLESVLQDLTEYKLLENGNYQYKLTTGTITINAKDYRQYASVSYGYRSLLSVEQDLFYFSENKLLAFDSEALQLANEYVNLITLVTLKIADINARKANEKTISKERLKESWLLILNESKNKNSLSISKYPKQDRKIIKASENNEILEEIITKKIEAYTTYNQLSESVFLRNIQVYFARQKWPTDLPTSNNLRSYYIESLIGFTKSLLELSNKNSSASNSQIIRPIQVQKALHLFLPSETNTFEDVTFFPNNLTEKIAIESYDLDAFRDSGFHWRILGYALDDLAKENIKSIDPNAAEQLVEGIAQFGVLVLRVAGEISKNDAKTVLDISAIEKARKHIQSLINTYDFTDVKKEVSKINSSNNSSTSSIGKFDIVNNITGVDFEHKSSDWLNRFIRSYSTSLEENVIKLSIPPAFGGSGVACEDLNNDGWMDILLLGGFGNKLLINQQNGSFKDVTQSTLLNAWDNDLKSYGEARQPIIADFDNNGTQDVFISYVNAQHKLYNNQGELEFVDVSNIANLGGENAVAGPATAFDFDNDGLLDIYIGYFGNYIEGILPTIRRDNQNGMPNKLFRNLGNFKFEEVDYLRDISSDTGWTQAVGHSDINQDGWQDVIVGNDFGVNKYYINNQDGTFSEISKQLGTDKPSYTMNVGITDLNGDFYPDFYISNIVVMQKDEKYVSPNENTTMKFDPKKMANIRTVEANDLFLSSVNNSEISYQLSDNIGRGYSATGWSWDADFFDFDNDGDEDLYCLNGMNDFSVYSSENPFYFEREEESKSIEYAQSDREKNVFFVNEEGILLNKAEEFALDLNSNARSASYFDFDEDGDLDIIINNYHEKATFLENKTSNENDWIKIKLIGNPEAKINNDAIGSSIIINGAIWREIHSTTGYLSVHPKQQHFGLGINKMVTLEVRWSNGERYTLEGLKANTSYEIEYPNKITQKD
ncbi:CRTAC1 family protein [Aureisphaera sp. CAU 1614]|uniref:CRTAC1 family protein n=1 Tax=Halomarinibacterium sedimenti TaxID=2857106 RepID=A0A9X1FMJ1_9FLAO|nr:CRTAC1 family protein [Halomarinibacterium sedimenti]MBW2937393.1 CRTAC1 family protein [Halomarinibacterium sedimenti]